MRNDILAQSYLEKAKKRVLILTVLLKEKAYSDVVREAQEIVELALKGMLRQIGVEPPKWHDVGKLLIENREKFLQDIEIDRLALISKRLRKERELSFYGDIDFIPTEEYTEDDATQAIKEAEFVVSQAKKVIKVS